MDSQAEPDSQAKSKPRPIKDILRSRIDSMIESVRRTFTGNRKHVILTDSSGFIDETLVMRDLPGESKDESKK